MRIVIINWSLIHRSDLKSKLYKIISLVIMSQRISKCRKERSKIFFSNSSEHILQPYTQDPQYGGGQQRTMTRLNSGIKNGNNFFAWAIFLIQKLGTNSVIFTDSGDIKILVQFHGPWDSILKIVQNF